MIIKVFALICVENHQTTKWERRSPFEFWRVPQIKWYITTFGDRWHPPIDINEFDTSSISLIIWNGCSPIKFDTLNDQVASEWILKMWIDTGRLYLNFDRWIRIELFTLLIWTSGRSLYLGGSFAQKSLIIYITVDIGAVVISYPRVRPQARIDECLV